MSNEIITQCPSCSTSFKVKEVQLNAAAGAVRCGACLVVFQATEHMLPDLKDDRAQDAESNQPANSELPQDARYSDIEKMFPESDAPALAKREDSDSDSGSDSDSDSDSDDEPLNNADSLNSSPGIDVPSINALDDSAVNELAAYQARLSIEFQTSNVQEQSNDLGELLVSKHSSLAGDGEGGVGNTLNDALIDDDATDFVQHLSQGLQEQTEQNLTEPAVESEPSELTDTNSIAGEQDDATITDDEHLAQKVTADGSKLEGRETNTLLQDDFMIDEPVSININVDPEPFELDHPPVSTIQTKQILWAAFSLFLILSLLLQFGWFNRNELSQRLELRDVYLQICERVQCQLTDFVDGSALTISDLVVRSHPTLDRSLVVDAILRNSARYQQKFPNLQLQFSDITGRAIASREFVPDEYLGGELTGRVYIPAATEVRLSLEIVDPGPEAVGHALSVLVN
ncbi:MAG: zinc-ribbon and DUF3426 domain-containing protein [Pseudomonadales bacterium]|nr:zinc-ribbon and DUF3426 domain-containing protein [Pseudomonadales bacterium]